MSMRKRYFFILSLLVFVTVFGQNQKIKVFLSCRCDDDFLKQNTLFFDYVRDMSLSDIEVFVFEITNASGGRNYSFNFNGKNNFLNKEYQINAIIPQNISLNNLITEWELSTIIYNDFQSLSDGQKRRGLLARALVYEPDILVLDEPFSNLDIKSNFILNQNLNKLIKQSVNIIYVTHSIESILSKTNRVLLIKEGKIINDGSPYDLINTKTLSNLFNISIKVIEHIELISMSWKINEISTEAGGLKFVYIQKTLIMLFPISLVIVLIHKFVNNKWN